MNGEDWHYDKMEDTRVTVEGDILYRYIILDVITPLDVSRFLFDAAFQFIVSSKFIVKGGGGERLTSLLIKLTE